MFEGQESGLLISQVKIKPMIEEARVPLGHLVLVIRSVRIDGAHEVRPTMPSSAAWSRSVPVRVTERVDEHCGEGE